MKKLTFLVLVALILAGTRAFAQEPKFVYEGRLTQSGTAATGSFEMQFKLYDTPELNSGTQQGATITLAGVEAKDGLFSVTLDFGAAAFNGGPRFLEISVKPAGAAETPTILSPRQPINPVPYAIHSVTASRLEGVSEGSFVQTDALGHVGIGTATPKGALQVASGGLAVTGHSSPYTGAGEGIFMEASSVGGLLFAYDYTAGKTKNLLLNSPGGRVGIGTLSPTAKLTVQTTSTFDPYGIEHTDGKVRLSTYLDGLAAWLGTRGKNALKFFINDGLPCLQIEDNGNVVITPNEGTGGYGRTVFGTPNGEGGMTIAGANRADIRFNGSALKLVAGAGGGPPASEAGLAVHVSGNVGVGTTAPEAKLDVAGNALVRGTTTTCVLEITGGCDLAEPFRMNEPLIDKGTVVVIDDENPGQLRRSCRAYDTRVAGIVSGAGGINTGIALRQNGALDNGQNVALTGRVYVKADASASAIKPGDLLTTSETPGYAMKVTDHTRAQGAILGKAMSRLDEGQGLVLVLVTLQ